MAARGLTNFGVRLGASATAALIIYGFVLARCDILYGEASFCRVIRNGNNLRFLRRWR